MINIKNATGIVVIISNVFRRMVKYKGISQERRKRFMRAGRDGELPRKIKIKKKTKFHAFN